MCNRRCNDRVRTGRSGDHRTHFDLDVLSGVTWGVSAENREFRKTRDQVFKTTTIDHSVIPPRQIWPEFASVYRDQPRHPASVTASVTIATARDVTGRAGDANFPGGLRNTVLQPANDL